jgi:hypothetical protein
VKATLPCFKPHQISLFSSEIPPPGHHIWKNGVCIDCGMYKSKSVVSVCDCGCKTPITAATVTTHYGKLTFVFGHETLNMFDDALVLKSKKIISRKKPDKLSSKKDKKKRRKVKKKINLLKTNML